MAFFGENLGKINVLERQFLLVMLRYATNS